MAQELIKDDRGKTPTLVLEKDDQELNWRLRNQFTGLMVTFGVDKPDINELREASAFLTGKKDSVFR